MTWSLVQSNSTTTISATGASLAFTSSQTAGNLIVAILTIFDAVGVPSITGYTDTEGNGPSGAYKQIATSLVVNSPPQCLGVIYYAWNIAAAGAGANTVALAGSFGTGPAGQLTICEFAWSGGPVTTDPIESGVANSDATGSTTPVQASLPSVVITDLVVAGSQSDNGQTSAGTIGGVTANLIVGGGFVSEWLQATVGGTISVSTLPNDDNWFITSAAFKAPPGPISGTASCSFSATGTLGGTGALTGTASCKFGGFGLTFPLTNPFLGQWDYLAVPQAWFDDEGYVQGQPISWWDEDFIQAPAGGAISGTATCLFTAFAVPTISSNAIVTFNASGVPTVSGNSTCTFAATGTLTGAGALASNASCTFTASGVPTVSGNAICTFGASGVPSLSATSTCTFNASGVPALAGNSSCTFNATGTATISGTASCVFAASGAGTAFAAAAGTASCTFNASGVPTVSGTSICTFNASGVPTISGTSACTFAASGSLVELIAGNASCVFNAKATPTIAGDASCVFNALAGFQNFIAGDAQCAFAATGSLQGAGALSSSALCTFSATSTPAMSGFGPASFAATGQLVELMIGTSSCEFDAQASFGGPTAFAACDFEASGQLSELIFGTALCAFNALATLDGLGSLVGTASCAFDALCAISSTGTATCAFDMTGVLQGLVILVPVAVSTRSQQVTLSTRFGGDQHATTSPTQGGSPSTGPSSTSGGPRTRR